MSKFIHLKAHTDASIMSSILTHDKLVEQAKKFNHEALAVTNSGNLFDSIEFYKECKKNSIRPILGCEFSVVDDINVKSRNYSSLILLAENDIGWNNLKRLVTYSNRYGYYYRPNIDLRCLEEFASGLICLSGGIDGVISTLILDGKIQQAEKTCEFLKSIFKQSFYLQVTNLGWQGEPVVRKCIRDLGEKFNIPVVATCDVKYGNMQDSHVHEVMLAIDAEKKMSDPTSLETYRGRPVMPTREFWFKDYKDIENQFFDTEIISTLEIAERCNVNIDFNKMHLPRYHKTDNGMSSYDFLRKITYDGFKLKGFKDNQIAIDRIKKELNDIKETGLEDYFLIMWDWINYAKNNDIRIGPGRGSCGGSLVAYCLNITEVDPLRYGLIWERFYNVGRKGSLADIDTDVEIEKRDVVLDYMKQTFGENRVCQMVTLNRLTTKNVLKDVGRVFDISFDEMNNITSHIPFKAKTIKQSLEESDKLKVYEKKYKTVFTMAERLEGIIKTRGNHAAGIIIADEDIHNGCIPLNWDASNKKLTTGFDMYTLDDLKYLKLDLLGLRTLSVIKHTEGLINHRSQDAAVSV